MSQLHSCSPEDEPVRFYQSHDLPSSSTVRTAFTFLAALLVRLQE